ncbi:MAG: TetR/AcrR family transcriptional regulator [Bacteroidota bacterium]
MDTRKEQILEAAKELFNRLGYTKTSVDDISKCLGMTKSSLYYYFKNKEEIFFEAFSKEWEENLDKFQQEALKYENPMDQLLAYSSETLKYHEKTVLQHKIPISTVVETRNMFREFVYKVNQQRLNFYVNIIEEGKKIGLFVECDSEKVAKSLISVKFALQYDNYNKFINIKPNQTDFKKIEEQVIFALRLMLKGIVKKS